jgi:hypothetical protein
VAGTGAAKLFGTSYWIWRLEEGMALLKKKEALCLELGNKRSLVTCYDNQAFVLRAWGRLEEAMVLLKNPAGLADETGLPRENKGTLETTQKIAAHESPRTTKLYDRTEDQLTLMMRLRKFRCDRKSLMPLCVRHQFSLCRV